jgi:hypothetical protein
MSKNPRIQQFYRFVKIGVFYPFGPQLVRNSNFQNNKSFERRAYLPKFDIKKFRIQEIKIPTLKTIKPLYEEHMIKCEKLISHETHISSFQHFENFSLQNSFFALRLILYTTIR